VSLELGGKGANLIFADADDKAVKSRRPALLQQHRAKLQRADPDDGRAVAL
jgi:hypothetical protein